VVRALQQRLLVSPTRNAEDNSTAKKKKSPQNNIVAAFERQL
jgi:hypothetical protein